MQEFVQNVCLRVYKLCVVKSQYHLIFFIAVFFLTEGRGLPLKYSLVANPCFKYKWKWVFFCIYILIRHAFYGCPTTFHIYYSLLFNWLYCDQICSWKLYRIQPPFVKHSPLHLTTDTFYPLYLYLNLYVCMWEEIIT